MFGFIVISIEEELQDLAKFVRGALPIRAKCVRDTKRIRFLRADGLQARGCVPVLLRNPFDHAAIKRLTEEQQAGKGNPMVGQAITFAARLRKIHACVRARARIFALHRAATSR